MTKFVKKILLQFLKQKQSYMSSYTQGRSDSSNAKFLHFFLFWGPILACLDPDPLAHLNPDPIRVRNTAQLVLFFLSFFRKRLLCTVPITCADRFIERCTPALIHWLFNYYFWLLSSQAHHSIYRPVPAMNPDLGPDIVF
jgi:hypothetical protein